jgi:hypothetical protein
MPADEHKSDFESFVREALAATRDDCASTATAILRLIPRIDTVEAEIFAIRSDLRDQAGALKLFTVFAQEAATSRDAKARTSSTPPPKSIPAKVADLVSGAAWEQPSIAEAPLSNSAKPALNHKVYATHPIFSGEKIRIAYR